MPIGLVTQPVRKIGLSCHPVVAWDITYKIVLILRPMYTTVRENIASKLFKEIYQIFQIYQYSAIFFGTLRIVGIKIKKNVTTKVNLPKDLPIVELLEF